MTVDRQVREQALDPAQSFIVEAPAGSGKTALLAQRYLRLLSTVERPESIVAMTFTRKAAAEMRERILNALLEARDNAPVRDEYDQLTRELAEAALEKDRKCGWNLPIDTGRLQIQTIDSLCAMLTRQMPVTSEFGGIGEVQENADELYRLAARRVLRDLAEGDPPGKDLFRRASLYFDNDLAALEKQVARMLELRDQWFALEHIQDSSTVADFCELLVRARDALRRTFCERRVVDFTEVTRAAIRGLGSPDQPTDLLYWLDYRIEHLLVDEFQDTSRAQYDLINALTAQWSDGDGRTVFLVGDPMQSIYRFRGAEISLFLKSWQEQRLKSVRLVPLRLSTNFRCTPEILRWVEEKFSLVMLEDDPLHGAIAFRPSCASRPASGVQPALIPLIEDEGKEEAAHIVHIIERAKDKGQTAILVRSRPQLVAILPTLRRAGIPYQAIEIDQLREQQHILDLIALSRAIVHVGDRLAWLACLRAPWCGLTLADLGALAENEFERTIIDLLSDPAKIIRLSSDGRARAVGVQEIMSRAVASVGKCGLRELVERTWMALGGPAILDQPNQHDDVYIFLDLVEELEEGGIIRDFSLLDQRLESLYAKPGAGQGRVQVMTIFQAKGLEFDTVIIPKLAVSTRSSERELLTWTEHVEENGETTLLIAAQPRKGEEDAAYERIRDEGRLRDEHEVKRLFYVACTRARNELYLLGSTGTKNNGKECSDPRSGTFLRLIWDTVKSDFESARRAKALVVAESDGEQQKEPVTMLRRLPANWQAPRFDASVAWQPELRRAIAANRRVSYEWVSNTSRHVGTVVHELLKRASRGEASEWRLIESELVRLGVSKSDAPKAAGEVMRALTNTLNSERGRWILHDHAEARSEWAVGGRIQDKLINGTIDRMFRDSEGRLWIIDFKTSSHEGGGLETFLNEEQRRYRGQLESYGTLVSRLMKGPIWLGLYFPLVDAWREWQYEEETALTAVYTNE